MCPRPHAAPPARFRVRGLQRAGQGLTLLAAAMPAWAFQPAAVPPVALQAAATLTTPPVEQTAPPTPPAGLPPVKRDAPRLRLLPLEVTVNGGPVGSWTLLERDGVLYATADAFEEWRLTRLSTLEPFPYRDQLWYPLSAVPGFEAQLNFANQSVDLRFLPQAFASTRLATPLQLRPTLTPASLATFLNYDLSLTQAVRKGATTTRDLGGLFEIGVTGGWGVLTSSYVGRNLLNNDPVNPASTRRLETTFTRDMPEKNLTLRLGDSSTRAGSWGRPVYFGGLQISRNFGLTPGFITQPLPALGATSSAPSTVELYINDALRQTSKVPAGPFSIDNFPLLTGSGQARMVVRDVLGRETVVVQNFFSHASLLDAGLTDWSYELGAVRSNVGTLNADYGERFTSGLVRYGLTKRHTLEARAEAGQRTRSGGLGLVAALPGQMLGQAALAASTNATTGNGQLWLLGLEHTNLRNGFTFRTEGASRGYRQVGLDEATLPYKRQTSGSYNYQFNGSSSLGMGFARVDRFDAESISTYSANYSVRVGERGSLTFSLVRVKGDATGTSMGVNLLIPLDDGVNMSAGLSRRSGQIDSFVGANRSLARETGFAWRTLAGTRGSERYAEDGVQYQGSKGLLLADLNATSTGSQTLRLGAQGGLVAMDGQYFASRRVQDSFALVEVAGYGNVGLGLHGNLQARTDASGKALLTRLLPYQANSIRLDPTELPISAEIESIEQVVYPAARSAIKVTFPVRSGRGALIKILFEDGEPAPAGAEIELVGDKQEFYVARRGEAFVTGLQPKNQLRLKWGGKACEFAVELPGGNIDEIARIGPITCSGIKR